MMPRPMLFVVAGLALAVSATAALAAPLTAARDTGIYVSPNHSTRQVGVMGAGTTYEGYCQNGWCFVDTPTEDGWVVASDIRGSGSNGPGFGLDITIGGDGPRPGGGGGGFNDDDEEVAEVCFYTNSNFRGRSFCAEPGDASGRLNSTFNDAISSIEVIGDAEVEVCTDRNLRGTCTTIRRDTGRLNNRVNDRISSFEIY
jgi:hypothetical protein